MVTETHDSATQPGGGGAAEVTRFCIPLHLEERDGLRRLNEPIRLGVPLPQGAVRDPAAIAVTRADGVSVPHQATALAHWPDRSVKWLLIDALASLEPRERLTLLVQPRESARGNGQWSGERVRVHARADAIEINTGGARFEVRRQHAG